MLSVHGVIFLYLAKHPVATESVKIIPEQKFVYRIWHRHNSLLGDPIRVGLTCKVHGPTSKKFGLLLSPSVFKEKIRKSIKRSEIFSSSFLVSALHGKPHSVNLKHVQYSPSKKRRLFGSKVTDQRRK